MMAQNEAYDNTNAKYYFVLKNFDFNIMIILGILFIGFFHFGILTIYIELECQKFVYIGFWGRGIVCTYI